MGVLRRTAGEITGDSFELTGIAGSSEHLFTAHPGETSDDKGGHPLLLAILGSFILFTYLAYLTWYVWAIRRHGDGGAA